jgi:hypothetical protein
MRKSFLLTIALLALGTGIRAQGIDNPAENAFLDNGFLRVGEFQNTVRNNVGAASFLFPSGDKMVTGLHSSIAAEDFLTGLRPVNSCYGQVDYNLVSYGWKDASAGFHTVEIGARVNYGLSVPEEVFRILKTGTAQSPYDLSSLKAFGNMYGEIVYGYSRPVGDNLSLGARVKFLAGLNSVDMVVRKLDLITTEDEYGVAIDADIDLTSRNKKAGTDENGFLDYSRFSGKGKLGAPTGAGLALDLGLVWKPFRGFTLSASAMDLGGILWYYGNAGMSSGTYSFEGLKDLTIDEMDQDALLARIKSVGEGFLSVVKPKAVEGLWKLKAVPLAARMKASYALPFLEMLSVDVRGLYTGYRYCVPYWETRGGLSLDCPGTARLELSAGSGACGFVYGASGSVDFLSFNLYACFENGTGGVIPYEDIPLHANSKLLRIGLIYKL